MKMSWSELNKLLALVFINLLAFWFDAEWIQIAIVVDALILGVEIKSYISNTTKKEAN